MFELAEHLSIPASELAERMDSAEFVLWQARFAMGWHRQREDARWAQLNYTIAASAGVEKMKPSDWMPKYEDDEQRPKSTAEKALAFFAAHARPKKKK